MRKKRTESHETQQEPSISLIDFDKARRAWRRNKQALPKGMFRYRKNADVLALDVDRGYYYPAHIKHNGDVRWGGPWQSEEFPKKVPVLICKKSIDRKHVEPTRTAYIDEVGQPQEFQVRKGANPLQWGTQIPESEL